MKRHEKTRIIEAKRESLRRRYNTFDETEIGYFAYYTKTDTTANGLTSCVIDFLTYTGWQAERISVQGQARVRHMIDGNTGQRTGRTNGVTYTKSAMTKGSADISATIAGRSIKIEVKMKDKQSPEQVKYQQAIEQAGGEYWLVHNMTEFFEYYDRFINRQNKIT